MIDNIRLLLNRFLNSIFISPYTKDLYEITVQINNFQSNIYDPNPTVNMYDLKNIHEDVSKMIKLFSGIGFDWWNIENIEDNNYFKDIFTKLESSRIIVFNLIRIWHVLLKKHLMHIRRI